MQAADLFCVMVQELQRGLDKLAVRLVPWQPPDSGASSTEAVKVEDMMVLVDSLLENTCTGDDQKLFDVLSLSGVYPRMNEVYTRLGEMTTAMRNVRDVLDLGTVQYTAAECIHCMC
ncbi:centrosomal protein of 70 kDa-like isoform X2 [Betta splendens]|uniref:Centrosomal protein of 70 kDa n=1 Tax=Betta splendens TaxID=158456 RepID=A0A8M1HMW7_BETSP|nr:centrosomal protein of 70 kDa-like isoform X2 [Betta splendens]